MSDGEFEMLTPRKNLNQWLWPVVLSFSLLLLALGGEETAILLRYDRHALLHGELWRLLTAHVVHLGWGHLFLNLTGLALIAFFFVALVPAWFWLMAIFFSAVAISSALLGFNTELMWYVGFSGILHSLFVVGGVADARLRPWEGGLFTALITIKVLWEQLVGPLPGSEAAAGGPVLVDAHFYGFLAGLLMAPLAWRLSSGH